MNYLLIMCPPRCSLPFSSEVLIDSSSCFLYSAFWGHICRHACSLDDTARHRLRVGRRRRKRLHL